MSAIAGLWALSQALDAAALCGDMLGRLARYGPDDQGKTGVGPVAMGRCLYRTVPEDEFDRQPLIAGEGRYQMVADIRIDNRDELLAGLGRAEDPRLPDSEILFQSWLKWGEGALDRLVGDYAFAAWDAEAAMLWLVRDPMGERPLHYCQGPGYFAFASLAQALIDLPGMARAPDAGRVAQFVADLPAVGSRSFFQGIRRVEPGCFIRIRANNVESRRYFDPRGRELRLPRVEDYGDALREQLDRSVASRLRRVRGKVGSHLSSGFDSSAVTTSAAILQKRRGERLYAFTSAPRPGFDGPVPSGRIADESMVAGETAALYSNIDHVVVRPADICALSLFDADHRDTGQPVGHVCNNIWYSMICDRARELGVSVLLTGEAGNFTISAGLGLDELPNFLRRGRLAAWFREAYGLTRDDYRWRNILHASLGPWLPKRLYLALRGLQQDFSLATEDLTFVASSWREKMASEAGRAGWDVLPPRDSKNRRWKLLQNYDPGAFRKRSLTRWGVEERDATADSRLIKFCFSLPPEAFLKHGVRRPAMRHALHNRLPNAVMEQKLRGYQMADWHEHLSEQSVRALVDELVKKGGNNVVDLKAVQDAAQSWPSTGWDRRSNIYFYRTKLLRALSASHFLASAGNSDA